MQRFTLCFALGLALAALGLSSAQAGTRPGDRAGVRGIAQAALVDKSDVVSRYVATHPVGIDESDVVSRYLGSHQATDRLAAAPTSNPASSGGFNWGDYGAGAASAIALFLLLAAAFMAKPLLRRQPTAQER